MVLCIEAIAIAYEEKGDEGEDSRIGRKAPEYNPICIPSLLNSRRTMFGEREGTRMVAGCAAHCRICSGDSLGARLARSQSRGY